MAFILWMMVSRQGSRFVPPLEIKPGSAPVDRVVHRVAEIYGQESPGAADRPHAAAVGRSRAAEGGRAGNFAGHATTASPEEVILTSGFRNHDGKRRTVSVAVVFPKSWLHWMRYSSS